MADEVSFEESDIVWVKLPRWPRWPAQIISIEDERYEVQLLGSDEEFNIVEKKQLIEWKARKPLKRLPRESGHVVYSERDQERYQRAVEEAKEELKREEEDATDYNNVGCTECGGDSVGSDADDCILLCDHCDKGFHLWCVDPPLAAVPPGDWFCCDCRAHGYRDADATDNAAIGNVMARYGAHGAQPALREPVVDVPPADLKEVHDPKSNVRRMARVVHRRSVPPAVGFFLQYDEPEPAEGVWRYYAKEAETLDEIARVLYPADVTSSVREMLVSFQCDDLKAAGLLTLGSKLQANTPVRLPEFHVTCAENETLETVAKRYGRKVEHMIDLNRERMEALNCGDDEQLQPASALPIATTLLLPAQHLPFAHEERPRAPQHQSPDPSEIALLDAAMAAGRSPLQIGERIGVATSDEEGVATMMENVTWRCATVRTSPKATTEGDDACFVASDCGGDADWRLHLKLSEEGADWQRIIEWPAPFQANPKGLAGSGSLVPPFAWVRKTERFTRSDFDKFVVPRPPQEVQDAASTLNKDDDCEVLVDGAWHAAYFGKRSSSGRCVEAALCDRDNYMVVCRSWQVRRCTNEPQPAPTTRAPKRRQRRQQPAVRKEQRMASPQAIPAPLASPLPQIVPIRQVAIAPPKKRRRSLPMEKRRRRKKRKPSVDEEEEVMGIKDEEREEEEEVAVVGQCQRKQYCCLGFNHMGKGGPCKIIAPAETEEEEEEEAEEDVVVEAEGRDMAVSDDGADVVAVEEEEDDEDKEKDGDGDESPGRLRPLRVGEFMAGSARLTKKCASYGAQVLCVESNINAPEYGEFLPRPEMVGPKPEEGKMAKAMKQASNADVRSKVFLEICQCRDLDPAKLPTLDYAHFSPQCISVSDMGKNLRNESNEWMGPETDQDCVEYNRDLEWVTRVIRDQKMRKGNEEFKFTIEAPEGVAKNIIHLKMVELKETHGGLGGTRVKLSYCKFGESSERPTNFWTNIVSMIEVLKPGTKHPHLCCAERPCQFGHGRHKQLGREGGAAADAAKFPPDLVTFLAWHAINHACAHRANDDVKA